MLVVDDQLSNLRALSTYLSLEGLNVSCVSSGAEGLLSFETLSPDLVLLDLVMPQVGGIDVLRKIRGHRTRGDTPVILMTGMLDKAAQIAGLEAGADDFLEKPLDPEVLLARTRTLLGLKASRDDLRASHAELTRRNQELELAQREQRELMEFIVHDLKGPLTSIVANTEWVYEQLEHGDSAHLSALEDVLGSAGRLRAMINDLMAVSQLERGTFPIRRRAVVMGPWLSSVTHEFSRAAALRKIELSGPADFPGSVQLDVELIRRVLGNILENSLRYTPERGKVSVSANLDDAVEIRVENNGPPIPERERELIFEKFRRGAGEHAQSGNAGLGLYFCKRAVEAHGGQIEVVETPDYPTCFLIRLPAA